MPPKTISGLKMYLKMLLRPGLCPELRGPLAGFGGRERRETGRKGEGKGRKVEGRREGRKCRELVQRPWGIDVPGVCAAAGRRDRLKCFLATGPRVSLFPPRP